MAERGEDAELGGIADEDVEAAVTGEQLCGALVDLDESGQVDRNERGAAAGDSDAVVELLEPAHRARREDDMGSLGGKAPGDCSADAARGAGDQRDIAGKTVHRGLALANHASA